MDSLTNLKLAELRQHDLAVDAARARLAAEARRARRHQTHIDWRRRIARRWQRLRTATTRPAPATPTARPIPFDDLAAKLTSNGPAAIHDELTRFVKFAAARGATPSLLSILAGESQPDVARQRAFGRIAAELSDPRLDTPPSAQHVRRRLSRPPEPDAGQQARWPSPRRSYSTRGSFA
jgi:hypothetical protein